MAFDLARGYVFTGEIVDSAADHSRVLLQDIEHAGVPLRAPRINVVSC
jgi:hypothetical protein